MKSRMFNCFMMGLFVLCNVVAADAYTIKNINATFHDGQVFITWTCPNATGLKYNIYRSTTKFTDTSQLNAATYYGNVRDSSCKNIRLSMELEKQLFFRIGNIDTTLHADQGLYVVTCTDNQSYYYCVTVTKLSNGLETKKIKKGKTTLKKPIAEAVADPQPIVQDSADWNNGDHVIYYAWFTGNHDAPGLPAMNSQGSYAFNFYVIKRGNAGSYPLFAFYEGLLENSLHGNGLDSFDQITNCYILGFDDWIPVPNGPSTGENTFWCGYHENYDFYRDDNSIPTSGLVIPYSQRRYIHSIEWAQKKFPLDTNRTYVVGVSAGGMGAYLTAHLIPSRITYAYCVVGDFKVITIDNNDTQPEQMWGDTLHNLATDVLNPETGDTIHIFNLFDERQMMHINHNQNMPLFQCVYGKNDLTIPWTPLSIGLIDSLNNNRVGGAFIWDQRSHDGSGKNFNDDETMPDWYSYANNLMFPAFSNCTINANPGNGTPSNGDSLGFINGYLTYQKDSVTDESCEASLILSVKKLYVGGLPYAQQYDSCHVDVTLRRAQNFLPLAGQTIKWKNYDSTGAKIQSGSFVYNGGLITIPYVRVNSGRCLLDLKIASCNKAAAITHDNSKDHSFTVEQSGNSCRLLIQLPAAEGFSVSIFNLMGALLLNKSYMGMPGTNSVDLGPLPDGIHLITVSAKSWLETKKVNILK